MTTTNHQKRLEKFLKSWSKIPELGFIKKLKATFPHARVYLVGGMVRDLALGRDSKDYDFVVSEVPGKKLMEFLKTQGEVNLVGRTFGVYKFKPKKTLQATSHAYRQAGYKLQATDEIDIALPRTEHAFGTGGYRDVSVKSDYRLPIEEDLKRRDFTINAMALKLQIANSKLQIVDPFGGLKDLERKIIRCVGKSEERFREDYSRILRAIRFACQLDFEIHNTTWLAIKKYIKNLNATKDGNYIIAREIIAKELVKAFEKNPVWALELFDKSGALKELMPELLRMKRSPQPPEYHSEGDVWQHTVLALGKLQSKDFAQEFSSFNLQFPNKLEIRNWKLEIPPEVVWSILFHDIGKPYTLTMTDRVRNNGHDAKGAKLFRNISERLRLSSAGLDVDRVEKLIAKHLIATQAKEMKETTLEKYFFNDQFPGQELLMLTFIDISATISHSGKPDFTSYQLLKKRVMQLKKKSKNEKELPKGILDGHEIMKLLAIKPSKKVQEAKDYLRELQLKGKIKTKVEAKKICLKKYITLRQNHRESIEP